MASWDVWDRLERVVQHGSFMSANEDFQALKTAVLKQSDALPAQRQHAALAWDFLLGFADKKTFYRSHVCQVVTGLLADPGFKHAYASNPALQKKAAGLHADVRKVLEAVHAVEEVKAPKVVESPKPKVSGKDVVWPDWDALAAAVRMDHFMGSNEEFRVLRLGALAADPAQLAGQVDKAPLVWKFLAGFGEKKTLYRSQMAEVIGILRQEKGWEESLDAVRPELQDRLQLLPDILQQALGADHAEAEAASNSASFSQENLEPTSPVQEDLQGYSSPSFESLEERLKSMMGYMEGLAGASTSPEEAPVPTTAPAAAPAAPAAAAAPAAPAPAAAPAAPAAPAEQEQEQLRVQEMEKLLKASEEPKGEAQPEIPTAHAEPVDKATALLQWAQTLESQSPVVGYYLQVYALELLITAKQAGRSSHESDQMMLATLQTAELKKGQLNLTGGPAKTQNFVLQIYDAAVASDSLQKLLDASLYLETLSQFYGAALPFELTNRASYAQLRADYLASCLQQGKPPGPAKPPSLPVPTLPGATTAAPAAAAPTTPAAPAATMPPRTAPPAVPPAAAAAAAPQAAPAAPAAPAQAKMVPQPAIDVSPEVAQMPRAKRQAEARKKTDHAISALKAGNEDSARAMIREALGLLEGL